MILFFETLKEKERNHSLLSSTFSFYLTWMRWQFLFRHQNSRPHYVCLCPPEKQNKKVLPYIYRVNYKTFVIMFMLQKINFFLLIVKWLGVG